MVKQVVSWREFNNLVSKLVLEVQGDKRYQKIEGVYGIPRGGNYVALAFSQMSNIPIVCKINDTTLILDDINDSGKTLSKYHSKGIACATLFTKAHSSIKPHFYSEETENWVVFPWENSTNETVENNVTRILELIGENPNREGLVDTPKRIAKMYKQLYYGYEEDNKPSITVFDNGNDGIVYDQMLTDEGPFYSTCEHHQMPFFGKYYFGYIPNPKGKILGLSKIARIIDYYSAKLQIQERIVAEVVRELWEALDINGHPPLGMILVLKGKHLCKSMRGVKKEGFMTSSYVKGVLKDKPGTRMEFFELIKLKGE